MCPALAPRYRSSTELEMWSTNDSGTAVLPSTDARQRSHDVGSRLFRRSIQGRKTIHESTCPGTVCSGSDCRVDSACGRHLCTHRHRWSSPSLAWPLSSLGSPSPRLARSQSWLAQSSPWRPSWARPGPRTWASSLGILDATDRMLSERRPKRRRSFLRVVNQLGHSSAR